jgi:hypothetical protein
MKKKYPKYDSYKDARVVDMFTTEQLTSAVKLEVYELSSSLLINNGTGKFTLKPLPLEAQFSPIYGIEIDDFNSDGNPDILLGGNLHKAKPQVGRYDASYGVYLEGDGKGGFVPIPSKISGINIDGEVRDIATLSVLDQVIIIIARNNNGVVTYKINTEK